MSNRDSRILGCMIGNTIGDAFGGVVEFFTEEKFRRKVPGLWLDDFLPYNEDHGTHPLGLWEAGPPRGTGTDDTRNNQMFADCVVRNKGFVNSQVLAIEYIEAYRDREARYPKHVDLAEEHYRGIYERACAYLGMVELSTGRNGPAVAASGNGFPALHGLISLAFAGLLYENEPEAAYRKAFDLAFLDIGYAKDATAMMAAMISAALGGKANAKKMIKVGLDTDPLGFGRNRKMARKIRDFIAIADEATGDRDLIDRLAREVRHLHPFDPLDVLGVPVAAMYYCDGDPIRTIVMAANDRNLNPDGSLKGLRDVDCTAGVAGALVGALHGVKAFPDDWTRDAVQANRKVYGIDLEQSAAHFSKAVFG